MNITIKIEYGDDKVVEGTLEELLALRDIISGMAGPDKPDIEDFKEAMRDELEKSQKETIYVPYPYYEPIKQYPIWTGDQPGYPMEITCCVSK